jgi:hypothetical protein
MKYNYLNFKWVLTIVFATMFLNTFAGVLTISGVYSGKNIYVQNPLASNMRDYCTNEVYINDVKRDITVNSSAYEIDLSFLKLNDPVVIKITHKDDCKPKILNAQVIKAVNAFAFTNFTIDKDYIYFATKGETAKSKITIEQMRTNTWQIVKEIPAHGSNVMNSYQTDAVHHSGLNKYRLKYVSSDGIITYSEVHEFTSTLEPVTFYPKRVTDKIYLSREVEYEIQDGFGNVVRKGFGKEVDISSSSTGVYYLFCDNQEFKIFKK